MATFQAIGLNLAIGSGVFAASLIAFSAAVQFEFNSLLAPRTSARPKQVIKNVLSGPSALYGLAWIPWTLKLSYMEMLEGIPGTGTRKNGWSGSLLKCNLDGIIAIKFHAMCFKAAIFATLLCICVILPINITAQCYPEISGEAICANMTRLTNFEVTTLAHIPPMDFVQQTDDDNTNNNDDGIGGQKITSDVIVQALGRYFWTSPGITSRLFVIVFCAWAIFIYTCYLIWNEWIDNLALRRVFYLEHDHFHERKMELEYLASLEDPESELQKRRPPYIPHPEIRDTLPNVALYSVLYKLPKYLDAIPITANSSMLDRQLSSTVDFFDRCVPNQPGFSSSVAAVTILPDTSQTANAWSKWYVCAKRLRRLRFIRHRIQLLESIQQTADSSNNAHQVEEQEEEIEFHAPAPSLFPSSLNSSGGTQTTTTTTTTTVSVGGIDASAVERRMPSPRSSPTAAATDGGATCSPNSSPRHQSYTQMKVLSTVDEQDDVLSTSDSTDPTRKSSRLVSTSQNQQLDIESKGALETSSTTASTTGTNAIEPACTVNLAARTRDYDADHEDLRVPEKGDSSPSEESPGQEHSLALEDPLEHFNRNEDTDLSSNDANGSHQTPCRESHVLYSGTLRSPTASWVPSVSTGSLSTPPTNEDIPSMDWRQYAAFPSADRLKSPEKMGLSEEAKLDMFLAEDGMEQLSVYSREFAQSSATCCPNGCDYYTVLLADLQTLKELEEEAEEMAQEANKALMEARASVNKMNLNDVEVAGGPNDSFIGRRELLEPSRLSRAALHSHNKNAAKEAQNVGESNKGGTYPQPQSPLESCPQQLSTSSEQQWKIASEIAVGQHNTARRRKANFQPLPSGRWHFDLRDSFLQQLRSFVDQQPPYSLGPDKRKQEGKRVGNVVGQHTYAVVTFTSRQAAIAARQCMVDGSGLGRWEEVEDLPVPPLADAPPWDLLHCRGCCRPVTFTINDSQKRCRNNCTWLCLILFCCLYTIPLSLTSNLLSTDQLARALPGFEEVGVLSGILTGLLYTGFFSICPFIFKAFANFGSGATSLRIAEFRAIQYYWIFIVLTAFTGSSLATLVTSGIYSVLNLGQSAQEVLIHVAAAIPTQVSATWLNWIIVRSFVTVPFLYLLQSNTFLFTFVGLSCCARCTRGGGPGGPLPFRTCVDSGTVFLCIVALAPACPLVAPAGMVYFLIFTPVLRWLLLFVYRPQYDGGGMRWPLLHEILISSMIVAQILLTTMMVLKKAYGPAFLAALSIVPTVLFGEVTKERFLRCYQDAGLVQTSQLDGWDISQPTSPGLREEFRQWLVDCHKASYVPICLAGAESFLTAEPAVVLPTDQDTRTASSASRAMPTFDRPRINTMDSNFVTPGSVGSVTTMEMNFDRPRTSTVDSSFMSVQSSRSYQKGALFRRIPHSNSTHQI